MSIEYSIPNSIDKTETDVKLSPEAMNLAHDIAIHEGEQRDKGYTAERITFLRGKEFGFKIASLALRDPTAPLIYRPVSREAVASETRTPLAKWARSTYEQNVVLSGTGGVRDRAFKD